MEQDLLYVGGLRVGGELEIYTPPVSDAGRLASIVYSAAGTDSGDSPKEDVCSVDAATGKLTAGSAAAAGDKCLVTATLTAPGRAVATSGPVTVVLYGVAAASQTAPSGWSDPYGASPEVAVGADSNAPDATGVSGTGALDYRVKSGSTGCDVHHQTGVVTGINTNGGCEIEAQFLGDADTSPSPWSDVASISITVGVQAPPMAANSGDIYIDNSGASCTDADTVRVGATSTGPCWPLPGNMGMGMSMGMPMGMNAGPHLRHFGTSRLGSERSFRR